MQPKFALETNLAAPMAALRVDRNRFVALAFCWADVLMELDGEGRMIYVAGAAEPLFGQPVEALLGSRVDSLVDPRDRLLLAELLVVAARRGRTDHPHVRFLGRSGAPLGLAFAACRLEDLRGHYFIALRANAANGVDGGAGHHDEATGLCNGAGFIEMVGRHMAAGGADDLQQVTLFALTGYKELQERLSQSSERTLLATLGTFIKAHVAESGIAARVGEDRYGLLHSIDMDVSDLENELAALTRQVDPAGQGSAVRTAHLTIDRALAGNVHLANGLAYAINRFCEMRESDLHGGDFSCDLSLLANRAVIAIGEFRRVIDQKDFTIAFQPIVDAADGRIHHYEALARFTNLPGMSTPYEHITFAEQTRLIVDFDLAMVAKVMDWIAAQTALNDNSMFAVNISGQSVNSLSFLGKLDALLADNPWTRGRLMFEVTESARMDDLESANTFIQRLRQRGYPVCLDDFGAGAANFQYLGTLDVDIVKIDGSALGCALKAHKGMAFLKAFFALCHELGVATIAEAVEDESAFAFVRDCGVRYVQGYLFGRPQPSISLFRKSMPRHLFPENRRPRRGVTVRY
jgi:EAL domain-containing protein (putative c-di-GMP-specific phosphodiesterase class I)/GGDEF domain-containing protein